MVSTIFRTYAVYPFPLFPQEVVDTIAVIPKENGVDHSVFLLCGLGAGATDQEKRGATEVVHALFSSGFWASLDV